MCKYKVKCIISPYHFICLEGLPQLWCVLDKLINESTTEQISEFLITGLLTEIFPTCLVSSFWLSHFLFQDSYKFPASFILQYRVQFPIDFPLWVVYHTDHQSSEMLLYHMLVNFPDTGYLIFTIPSMWWIIYLIVHIFLTFLL